MFHHPGLRRESYGELIKIDNSEHRWFENCGEPFTLLVFIDDATRLLRRRFMPSESTVSYFETRRGYLDSHGCPVAFTWKSTRFSIVELYDFPNRPLEVR